jgi:hypothetical protein
MTFDGLHQRLWGDYVRLGGQLGLWEDLALTAGIDPGRLALTFMALGLGLVGASFGVYLRRRWGYSLSLIGCGIALLYLTFGTLVALAGLVLLVLPATRRYVLEGARG